MPSNALLKPLDAEYVNRKRVFAGW
jgi:hypothetical protein